MYSISIATDVLGVCIKTLRRWDEAKKIRCVRTPGGHRRFLVQEIQRIMKGKCDSNKKGARTTRSCKICANYGRVSSHKQYKCGDLDCQVEIMKAHAHEKSLTLYKIYKDIVSGLNTRRRGLWRLIRDAKDNKFSVVLINYKDRLTRLGYKYLQQYLSEFGVKIKYLNELADKSPESDMVEDLVAIIHSFSGKLYGLRSSKNKKNIRKNGLIVNET